MGYWHEPEGTLAFYIYPLPGGTGYGMDDLLKRAEVIELFDYCQILEAVISKQGWDFLISHYGYGELFRINEESDWFDCRSEEEFILCVKSERHASPDRL